MGTEDRKAPKWNNPIWRRVEVSTWARQGGRRIGSKERRSRVIRSLRWKRICGRWRVCIYREEQRWRVESKAESKTERE